MAKLVDSLPVQNTLGEGVACNPRDGNVWWTDIESRMLYRLKPKTKQLLQYPTSERLAAFAFTEDKNCLLAAFETGFALLNVKTGNCQWLHRPPELQAGQGLRLNDGRLDPHGRFWCGAMVEQPQAGSDAASLYCLHSDGQLVKKFSQITISNGICWSPTKDKFYFADSPRRTIYSFKYDADTGNISDKTVFAKTEAGSYPDGAVTDSDGFLWSAHWGGSKVVRYAPDGSIDEQIDIPASQPSCVAFGGDDNSVLYVTSARQNLSNAALAEDIEAGNLFVFETDVSGIAEPVFDTRKLAAIAGRY